MARVTITRQEAERGLLPPLCALTGVPTEDSKRKAFLWQPGWVAVLILAGLLPYLIVSLVMRKTMTVNLPLVREKHGHWMWRTLVGVGAVLLSIALMVGAGVVGSNRGSDQLSGALFAVGIIGFLVALIVWLVLNGSCIRPAEITDRDITLVGVHRNFVDALEDDREREEEEYERERDRRRRDRDDDYDDRRRRSDRDDDDDRPRRAYRADDDRR